jgi:hypothetical protein
MTSKEIKLYSNLKTNGDPFHHLDNINAPEPKREPISGTPKGDSPETERMLQVAWCAGLFDGDGCIVISKQKQPGRKNFSYRLTLSLVQNCYVTVDHFRSVLGIPHCLVEIRRKIQHNRQIYDLRFDGLHSVAALRLLMPFLVRKAVEAQAALDFWVAGSMGVLPGRNGLAAEVWVTRERYYKKLRKLK